MGRPGIVHDQISTKSSGQGFMDDPSTERTLNRKLRGLLMCLLYFLTIHGCLYNQVPAHVRSTGAGNKYLYCKHCDKKKLPVDHVQCRLLIPALKAWAARVEHTTARLFAPPNIPCHGRIYDVTTDPCFDSQATCCIDVFDLFLDMLFMGVCTTRHWQTSGRLVQELNICTVYCSRRTMIALTRKHYAVRVITAPVDRTSSSAWSYKHAWIACQR